MIASWMLTAVVFSACAAVAAWAAVRVGGHTGAHAITLPALEIIAHPLPRWMGGDVTGDAELAALWVAASPLLLLRLLRSLRALTHARRHAEESTLDGVSVLVTPALGPAAIGTRHPRIIVPRWLFDLDEPLRAFVLRHEQEHCRPRERQPARQFGSDSSSSMCPRAPRYSPRNRAWARAWAGAPSSYVVPAVHHTILSATSSSVSVSWPVTTTAQPSAAMRRNTVDSTSPTAGATSRYGSSASTHVAPRSQASATSARRRSPPEHRVAFRST